MANMLDLRRRLWTADAGGLTGKALSALLTPAEWLYSLGVAARAFAFDSGVLSVRSGSLPTLAVGNLTVGGTGKTPMAAWFACELRERGWTPAVVMRGYGGDEVKAHHRLNPDIPVIAAANRLAAVERARLAGADIAVLDDAYQHRGLRPTASALLLAAEEWAERPRLLPRGPWREPLSALGRATLLIVTRKTATARRAAQIDAALDSLVPDAPRARAYIDVAELALYDGSAGPLASRRPLDGFYCRLAVAGVARPEALWTQLERAGLKAQETQAYPDHHRYTASDSADIRRRARGGPLVATLKDAVKLGPLLGQELEIYVPIQTIRWEAGHDAVEAVIADLSDRARGAYE